MTDNPTQLTTKNQFTTPASSKQDIDASMAEELFRTYEHLNILFEATRQLPNANTEQEAIRQIVITLRQSYADRKVDAIQMDNSQPPASTAFENPDAIDIIRNCVDTGHVVVECVRHPDGHSQQILAGPVIINKECPWVILISNLQDQLPQSELLVGDVQLITSLLQFGADTIRNLRMVDTLRELSISGVRALVGAIDQKDEYTAGHSSRVGYYAILLGKELRLNSDELQMLEWAALLHDVGKIGIRDDVLKKPGRLTDDEMKHIQSHPARSHAIVCKIPQLVCAVEGVRHHHERWDGKGYPDGLAGENIPLAARIIQIADVFDALTTTRPYREAWTWEKALGILSQDAGTCCDPELQRTFDQIIREMVKENPGIIEEIRDGTAFSSDNEEENDQ